ncbi:MAG TPA: ABC transporter substrate-binding protein [Alphaproteobacteria bacterium]|nr:ABC transporter substrate-binding protein [Alphaproteobacteria bacterium]
MTSNTVRTFVAAVALWALGLALPQPAAAETHEIRLAKQFSMGYVQFNVLEHQKLIEKHAAALGIPDLKVTWATFNGPDAMNTALVSGSVDVVSGGVPGLVTLWAKTKGTALAVRGLSALSSQPFLMNTREARIKTVKDLTDSDRIAVPAVKVSVQAVTLQMAAAQAFGFDKYDKLDALTLSLSPPDATIGLLGGSQTFDCVFSVPPFQQQQLENPGIHTVLNSFDVMGGPHTFTVAWTTAKFHDENPTVTKALMAALAEATDVINTDKMAAARLWIEDSHSKLSPDFVHNVLAGPQVKWTLVPENTMKYAEFMHKVGTIKEAPASWKDLFFPEIHAKAGS